MPAALASEEEESKAAPAGEQQPPTKSKKSKKARKPEPEAPGDGGGAPSVAAHPKAARQVARAKGWGGLVGFLLSGYLSLPTDTFAGAILRALVGGSICYLAAWAGAVFVWRRLVMLEYAGARARVGEQQRAGGAAVAGDSSRPLRRENVRVGLECPVVAYLGASRTPVQTFTVDVSAGGMLVAGLGGEQTQEEFEFELTIAADAPPIKGVGIVTRTDPDGRCAIKFNSIGAQELRRLDKFIFEHQRTAIAVPQGRAA
jgi:hypothetical protein